jgi:hypothetical protein
MLAGKARGGHALQLERFSITVQDEGQGFDSNAVPDPTTSENLLAKLGRGIYLNEYFDGRGSFRTGRCGC